MPASLHLVLRIIGTLALSALGGLAFEALGIPVSWLSGGMVAVGAAALAGIPVTIPKPMAAVVFFVVGLSIGAAITPETVRSIGTWPLSVLGMALTVVLMTASSYVILRWRGGWSQKDAFLASTPGALALIVALSQAHKADVARITLVQSLRVALLVLFLPPILTSFFPSDIAVSIVREGEGVPGIWPFVLLVLAGLGGRTFCKLVRLPSHNLLGAMFGSAVVHAGGWVTMPVPGWILIPALAALGAIVGSRFFGISWATVRRSINDGLMTFVAGLVIALGAAWIASDLLGFSLGQTALAFAPGGFDVMTVMAFALALDPAYVAAHHTVRFVGISILLPIILGRWRSTPDE